MDTQDMDRQPHKIWTDSHTRYGQTATQDMDKNNIEFYDLQVQLKIQRTHKIWTNSHTRYGQTANKKYGQTATQDMDKNNMEFYYLKVLLKIKNKTWTYKHIKHGHTNT